MELLGHGRGLGVQSNVGDCFLQFRDVIAEPAESSVASRTKQPSHLPRSVIVVDHQKPLPLQVSRTARRIAAARVTSQKAASFSKMFRSSLESNRCNWMSFGCICTKYRPDKYPRQGESKEKVYEKVRGLLPREGGWINGLTASRFGRLRFSQDKLRSLGRESGPDYPVNCWNTLKLRRHNVTCKGERDGLKSSAMTQWAISSQASHRLEGSTIIPSGSRAKRLEARDAHMGEDMTSSSRKREADQE